MSSIVCLGDISGMSLICSRTSPRKSLYGRMLSWCQAVKATTAPFSRMNSTGMPALQNTISQYHVTSGLGRVQKKGWGGVHLLSRVHPGKGGAFWREGQPFGLWAQH